jgi:hypothetical protein
MQTLHFNTTTKTVKLYEGHAQESQILMNIENVPTVKVTEHFYEVIVSEMNSDIESRRPVARFPVANTNMIIEK